MPYGFLLEYGQEKTVLVVLLVKKTVWFRAILVTVAVLAASAAVLGCGRAAVPTAKPPVAEKPTPPPLPVALSPITGEPLVKAGSPVAVSIDNYPNARPQTGLNEADIVYEALAEGGITRYLAVFHSRSPETVGPVRSARPYFALLAKEWGAVFGHCGGDPKDIQPIRDWNVVDGDEFGNGHLYWRDNSRSAPHNLYTSVENLRKVPAKTLPAPAKRYEFAPWAANPEAGLMIRYNKDYAVEFKYADHCYNRYIYEKSAQPWLHKDRKTEAPVKASNIIIQFAHSKVAYSDGGLIIDLTGAGKAAFLSGGVYSEGTWAKESVDKPTVFCGPDGKKISLAAGQTWVQIVPEDTKIDRIRGK